MIISLADQWSLGRKLSPRKISNAAKILWSYHAARLAGNPQISGLPLSVAFEPTTSCNLRCPQCPSGLRSFTRPTGLLNPEFFRQTLDEICSTLLYITFYFQGEPFLNRSFLDMVSHASHLGIYTTTSTNAHFLDEETARRTVLSGLDRLIISIDGATQEVYQSYRVGGSLKKVIDGTKNVIKWKKKFQSATPRILFQFLVVRPNEHQIGAIKNLGKDLGVDKVAFKTAQIYDYENGSSLIPENKKFSRYRMAENGSYEIKNTAENHCWKMWHSCVITWDGKVVPCCFDKDANHPLGDLKENSFKEIWNGSSYIDFRKRLFKSRSEIDICRNCTEGTRVWA